MGCGKHAVITSLAYEANSCGVYSQESVSVYRSLDYVHKTLLSVLTQSLRKILCYKAIY